MRDPSSLWEVHIDVTVWAETPDLQAADASAQVGQEVETQWRTASREQFGDPLELLINVRSAGDTAPLWLDVPLLSSRVVDALISASTIGRRDQIRSLIVEATLGSASDTVIVVLRRTDWRAQSRAMTSSDAVHGDMHFTTWERSVIDTLTFQRLRGIKQLGLADYVYHTAVHTRFCHSLGTCAMAKRIMNSLEQRGAYRFAPGEKSIVSMAALLHDVSHIPFGHTLEDEHPVFRNQERHDHPDRIRAFLGREDLAKALGRYGGEEVTSILLADEDAPWKHHSPYQVQIVKNTICADLLDYLRRDSWFCALVQDYDDRLLDAFEVVTCRPGEATSNKPHLVLRMARGAQLIPDILAETLNLLRMRQFLAERVYYNLKKIAYGAMLAKAVRLPRLPAHEFYGAQDHELLARLRHDKGLPPDTRVLAGAIAARNRYARAYTLDRGSFPEERVTKWEQFLSKHREQANARESDESFIVAELNAGGFADIREPDVVVYSPSTDMSLKEALVLAVAPNDEVKTVQDMKLPEVTEIYRRYHGIWRFCLFVNREKFGDQTRIDALREICRGRFDGLRTTDDVEL